MGREMGIGGGMRSGERNGDGVGCVSSELPMNSIYFQIFVQIFTVVFLDVVFLWC